eukprot:PhM_4_TR17587/c0_g1_i1/m.59783
MSRASPVSNTFEGWARWIRAAGPSASLFTVLTPTLIMGYERDTESVPCEHIKMLDVSAVTRLRGSTLLLQMRASGGSSSGGGDVTLQCRSQNDADVIYSAVQEALGIAVPQQQQMQQPQPNPNNMRSASRRSNVDDDGTDPDCPLHGRNSPYRSRRGSESSRTATNRYEWEREDDDNPRKLWERQQPAPTASSPGPSRLGGGGAFLSRTNERHETISRNKDADRVGAARDDDNDAYYGGGGDYGVEIDISASTDPRGGVEGSSSQRRGVLDDGRRAAWARASDVRQDGSNNSNNVTTRGGGGPLGAPKLLFPSQNNNNNYNDSPVAADSKATAPPPRLRANFQSNKGLVPDGADDDQQYGAGTTPRQAAPGGARASPFLRGQGASGDVPSRTGSDAGRGGAVPSPQFQTAQRSFGNNNNGSGGSSSLSLGGGASPFGRFQLGGSSITNKLTSGSRATGADGAGRLQFPNNTPGSQTTPQQQQQQELSGATSRPDGIPMLIETPTTVNYNTNLMPNPSAMWKQWKAPNGDIFYGHERTGEVLCRVGGEGELVVVTEGTDPTVAQELRNAVGTSPLYDLSTHKTEHADAYGTRRAVPRRGQEDLPASPRGPQSPQRGGSWFGAARGTTTAPSVYVGSRVHTITVEDPSICPNHTVESTPSASSATYNLPRTPHTRGNYTSRAMEVRRAEGRQQWEHIQHILMRGRVFLKHHFNSAHTSYRHVYLSQDGNYLCWVPTSLVPREAVRLPMTYYGAETRYFRTSEIARVVHGGDVGVTKSDPAKMFSILTGDRVLILECPSMEEATYWVDAWNAYLYYSVPGDVKHFEADSSRVGQATPMPGLTR